MPKISQQQGFSLIEILVAVLVVTIGLLGVAGMQLIGLKGNQQSFSKNQAAHHAQSILERMRGNPLAVKAGAYTFDSQNYRCAAAPQEDCGESTGTCGPDELAAYDLFKAFCGSQGGVAGGIAGDLSNASLIIRCDSDCDDGVTLRLGWDEQLLGQETSASNKAVVSRHLTINTVIKK